MHEHGAYRRRRELIDILLITNDNGGVQFLIDVPFGKNPSCLKRSIDRLVEEIQKACGLVVSRDLMIEAMQQFCDEHGLSLHMNFMPANSGMRN